MEHIEALKELIRAAGYEPSKYSGRGMYGRNCVAIRTDDNTHLVTYKMGREFDSLDVFMQRELEELKEDISQVRIDNIGHRHVLYFPSVEWADAPAAA